MEVLKQDEWKENVTEYQRKALAMKNRFQISPVLIFLRMSHTRKSAPGRVWSPALCPGSPFTDGASLETGGH